MSTIKLEKSYPVPKKAVWEYLVKDELLSSWCMPAKGFTLQKGQDFVFEITPNIFFGGTFYNKVTDFKENVFLSYQCIAKKPKLDTIVRWTLAESGGETKLTLEHSGFSGSQWLIKIMLASGWKKMMHSHLYNKLVQNNCPCPIPRCKRHGDCIACQAAHRGKTYCNTKDGSLKKWLVDKLFKKEQK